MAKAEKSDEVQQAKRVEAAWITGKYAGYETWPDNKWAWEFLRRNEDYGKDYQQAGTNKKQIRAAQDKWGLKELKAPDEDFGTGIVPHFKLRFRSFSYDFEKDDTDQAEGGSVENVKQWPRMSLLPGEIAITFQTRLDIRAQIKLAQARIIKRQKEWLEAKLIDLLKAKNTSAPINLIEQLKVYDDERDGKSLAKIGDEVFPTSQGKHRKVTGLSRTNDGSKNMRTHHVKTALGRAQDMVQDGYMMYGLKHRAEKAKTGLRKEKKGRQK